MNQKSIFPINIMLCLMLYYIQPMILHGYILSHLFLDIHDVTFNTQSFVPECEMNQHNTVLFYSCNINIY